MSLTVMPRGSGLSRSISESLRGVALRTPFRPSLAYVAAIEKAKQRQRCDRPIMIAIEIEVLVQHPFDVF